MSLTIYCHKLNRLSNGVLVTGPVPGAIVDIKGAFIGPGESFMALLR